MKKKKAKTYLDTLMADKEFRKRFDEEYQNLRENHEKARGEKKARPNK